jgi:MFS family permease
MEGFPIFVTGLVMSLYYAGFLLGCYITPKIIASVGHVRVYAALASIASTTILLHGVFVDPWSWGIIRIFSGMSFAGLFIVTESWLSSIATNRLRGMTFGIYLFVLHGSLFIGQFLINLAPLNDIGLFVLISVLVSLALLPLTLANKPSPGYEAPESLPLHKLIKTSQLALASAFASGFCAGTVVGIGVVYAAELGQSKSWAAGLMASYILGSALIPLVIGSVSDRLDRRKVIIFIALCAFLTSLAFNIGTYTFILMFIFGGLATSIYSVGLAYMNDNIKPEQAVSASTSLILINAMGAMLGPLISGFIMDYISLNAFFYGLSVVLIVLFLFGLYRAYAGDKVIVADQGEFVHMPPRGSPELLQILDEDLSESESKDKGAVQ